MNRKKKEERWKVSQQVVESELARRTLEEFALKVRGDLDFTRFHRTYYAILNLFAMGKIKRLIISMPPQHGKSLGASILLPAFILGIEPNRRIAIASYSFSLARTFGQGVQQLIGGEHYRTVFPNSYLKGMKRLESGEVVRRGAEEFDIVGSNGGLKLVGRGGSLTGNRVDVMIMDDLYKDAAEANSPIIRESIWEWYTSVVRTRLHNDSQELIVFTRWHEDDLVGRISRHEKVVEVGSIVQLSRLGEDVWVSLNFEALKSGVSTEFDPRVKAEPLWAERHSREMLLQKQGLDPQLFESLYQGNPTVREGLLYSKFQTYSILQSVGEVRNYTDTADTGRDRLCSVCYGVGEDGAIYLLDLVYSSEPMETTEIMVSQMLRGLGVARAVVESNSGGRGFARALQRMVPECEVDSFHQSANKESRILTNASAVMARIRMPIGWQDRWEGFARELMGFRRIFSANIYNDAADVLTGIVEREERSKESRAEAARKIRAIRFG